MGVENGGVENGQCFVGHSTYSSAYLIEWHGKESGEYWRID